MKMYLSTNEAVREKKINLYRKINASVWAFVLVTVLTICLHYWGELGCTGKQLAAAIVYYSIMFSALCFITDQSIKEK